MNLTDRVTSPEPRNWLRKFLMISDVLCVIGAEIFARREDGFMDQTAATALCLPCSQYSGGLSCRTNCSGGLSGASSSGSSILSGVSARVPVPRQHINVENSGITWRSNSLDKNETIPVITYYYVLLHIIDLVIMK